MERTFPIRLAPLPGEPLDSWMEALAQRNRVELRDVLDGLGLLKRLGGSIPEYTVFLRPSEAEPSLSKLVEPGILDDSLSRGRRRSSAPGGQHQRPRDP